MNRVVTQSSYGKNQTKDTVWDHLQTLRCLNEHKLAEHRLYLIAKYHDDPVWIKQQEEKWLNEPRNWSNYGNIYGAVYDDWY